MRCLHQALADFLTEHPMPKDYFFYKYMISHAFSLLEPCLSNAAEYQALIVGLELALESGITMLEAFGDSRLIVN